MRPFSTCAPWPTAPSLPRTRAPPAILRSPGHHSPATRALLLTAPLTPRRCRSGRRRGRSCRSSPAPARRSPASPTGSRPPQVVVPAAPLRWPARTAGGQRVALASPPCVRRYDQGTILHGRCAGRLGGASVADEQRRSRRSSAGQGRRRGRRAPASRRLGARAAAARGLRRRRAGRAGAARVRADRPHRARRAGVG